MRPKPILNNKKLTSIHFGFGFLVYALGNKNSASGRRLGGTDHCRFNSTTSPRVAGAETTNPVENCHERRFWSYIALFFFVGWFYP